jgi:hypothetical protein
VTGNGSRYLHKIPAHPATSAPMLTRPLWMLTPCEGSGDGRGHTIRRLVRRVNTEVVNAGIVEDAGKLRGASEVPLQGPVVRDG